MDFFAAQERARRRTLMLIVPAVLALALIIILSYFLLLGCWWLLEHSRDGGSAVHMAEHLTGAKLTHPGLWNPLLFWVTAVLTTLLIAGGSIVRIVELREEGGNFIAHRLGAKVVRFDTTDLVERRLINIVEELSIAAGIRIPELFILEEDGINSFCAGHDVDSAVLIITRGAVDILDRDELQALLAHEFSHILNADMIINTRMVGVLHGLMMFTVLGRSLMLGSGFAIFSGAGFVALGYLGNLLGRAIQAMICRQREWLADAHALQFTRNPGAIVSVLKKIGGYHHGSSVPRPFAIESAHMFFANALDRRWFLCTHPPLARRIRAIAPGFNGVFPRVATTRKTTSQTILRVERHYREGAREHVLASIKKSAPGSLAAFAGDTLMRDKQGVSWSANVHWPEPVEPDELVTRISAGPGNPLFAAAIIEGIDPELREAVHNSERARLALFALLSDDANPAAQAKQQAVLASALSPEDMALLAETRATIAKLPAPLRLPLADLAMPALKALSSAQIDAFIRTITALIAADGKVSLPEYALRHIVIRQLRPAAAPHRVEMHAAGMAGSIAILLGAMAHAASDARGAALASFNEGKKHFTRTAGDRLQLPEEGALTPGALTMALSHVERAAPLIKKDILAALARAAAHDGVVQPAEQELLRAVAVALNCPAPLQE